MFRLRHLMIVGALVTAATMTSSCSDPERSKQRYIERGDKHVAAKKYQDAVLAYRNALKHDPKAGDVRLKLADAYLQAKNVTAALKEYVRAADLLPDNQEAQLRAGTLLLLARQFEDAKTRATAVLEKNPGNVDAQILQANAMAQLKDVDGAITELQEAIRLTPGESRTQVSLGALQLAKGQRQEAEAAFNRAVELNPKSVSARLALANFYSATGRQPDAENALKKALDIEPKNLLANRMLAVFYLSSRRQAEAEKPLKTVVEVADSPQARFALADYYLTTKRASDARQILDPLTKDAGSFAAASLRLALLEYTAGNREQGHRTLDAILARDAKNLDALTQKAHWMLQEGRPEEAMTPAKAAVAAEPRSASAHYVLGLVHATRGETPEATNAFNEVLKLNPRAADAQVQLSRLSLVSGARDAAVKYAEEATSSAPRNIAARVALARSLLAGNDIVRAEPEVKLLLANLPNDPAVQVLNGTLQMAKKDQPAARTSFVRALELQPKNREALSGLMALEFMAGRRDHAVSRVESELRATPDDPELLTIAARTYNTVGNAQKAEEALRRAVSADPSYVRGYALLGQLYLSQRRLEQARAEYETIARRSPDAVHAKTMVGVILQTQNKSDEARKWYEEIVAATKRAPVAANNLAYMYVQSGQNLDAALQLAQSAKEQMPDNPDVNDTLGWVYYNKELFALAIPPLEQSVKKDPQNVLYLYHLGLAYAKSGNDAGARRTLGQALKLQPNFDGAAQARQTLASLKG